MCPVLQALAVAWCEVHAGVSACMHACCPVLLHCWPGHTGAPVWVYVCRHVEQGGTSPHLTATAPSHPRRQPDPDTRMIQLQSTSLLQHCFIPRCMVSPRDALFCSRFLLRLHHINVPGFNSIICFDKVRGARGGRAGWRAGEQDVTRCHVCHLQLHPACCVLRAA